MKRSAQGRAAWRSAQVASREVVKARALGRCELCGERLGTDFSHRVAKGMGGAGSKGRAASDAPTNGLWSCRPCHMWVEAHPEESYARGWKLRHGQDPEAEPALLVTPYGTGWYRLAADGTYISD